MNPPSEVIRRSSSAGDAVGAGVEVGPAVGAGVAPPTGELGEGAAVVPQAAARMATTAPRTAIRDWGTERITGSPSCVVVVARRRRALRSGSRPVDLESAREEDRIPVVRP